MLINIFGAKCIGIDAVPVTVEVDINNGIGIHLVGLADAAVRESLLRIITALQSVGMRIPGKKIVINLAPADMHKNGSGYDLPIALGVIAASGQCELPLLGKYLIMGELGLDSSLRYVPGAIPIAELAGRMGFEGCILPKPSALEAIDYSGTRVYGVSTLSEVLEVLSGSVTSAAYEVENYRSEICQEKQTADYMDFSEIIGQDAAKRGLEIAAAGGHNVMMIGSPGSGKSSLAKAMAGILPPMTPEEALLTSKIYSVAGKGCFRYGMSTTRPFRSPHYSASLPAIVGGGNGDNIMPGEVSLAQNGILFLDEFAQIPKSVTEALRGPLEDRKVTISRLRSRVEYPSSFMLIAATNPCPCGYYGEGDRCTCTVGQRNSYLSRLSGPIMDRIDIQVFMRSVDARRLVDRPRGETTAAVAARVLAARQIQTRRFRDEGIFTNAEMNSKQLARFCPLDEGCKNTLEGIITRLGLSARAFSRVIKLARTIADLEAVTSVSSPQGSSQASGQSLTLQDGQILPGPICPHHLLEAAVYRFLDRRDFLEFGK